MSEQNGNQAVPFRKTPVELGQIYTATVGGFSKRGSPMAFIEGFAIFLDNCKNGIKDTVTFKIVKINARSAIAEIVV